MPRNYTVVDIKKHLGKRYGRDVSQSNLSRVATHLFGPAKPGQTKTFAPRQAVQIANQLLANSERLNLTPEKQSEIRTLLSMRAGAGPYKREQLQSIANVVSHPRAPISVRTVRKLNESTVQKMRERGIQPRGGTHNPQRAKVLPELRNYLKSNINATVEQLTTHFGLTYRQLQRIISKSKTTLDAERKAAKVKAIKDLDARTGRSLHSEEIAKRLGLKKSYVEEHWARGQVISTRNQINATRKRFLFLLGFFTTPESGVLSLDRLTQITGAPIPTARAAIKLLRETHLIIEDERAGSNQFCISPKGYRELNGAGIRPHDRQRRLEAMPLSELEDVYQMLENSRQVGLKVDKYFLEQITTILGRKRLDNYKSGFKR